MMDAAARARIRRLFFAEHWRIGTIPTITSRAVGSP